MVRHLPDTHFATSCIAFYALLWSFLEPSTVLGSLVSRGSCPDPPDQWFWRSERRKESNQLTLLVRKLTTEVVCSGDFHFRSCLLEISPHCAVPSTSRQRRAYLAIRSQSLVVRQKSVSLLWTARCFNRNVFSALGMKYPFPFINMMDMKHLLCEGPGTL